MLLSRYQTKIASIIFFFFLHSNPTTKWCQKSQLNKSSEKALPGSRTKFATINCIRMQCCMASDRLFRYKRFWMPLCNLSIALNYISINQHTLCRRHQVQCKIHSLHFMFGMLFLIRPAMGTNANVRNIYFAIALTCKASASLENPIMFQHKLCAHNYVVSSMR